MAAFLEQLESRTLFSANPLAAVGAAGDELLVLSDARTIRADVQHCAPLLLGDRHGITADLHGLPASASNRQLLSHLRTDEQKYMTSLKADVAGLLRTGGPTARKAIADGVRFFLNPTSAAARNHLAADLIALQKIATAPLATLGSHVATAQAAVLADLNAITAANPTDTVLQSAVHKAQTDSAGCITTATADVQTIQNDISALVKDLGGSAG
jgi:hypothetical protein